MMTSELVTPDGLIMEAEAAHGSSSSPLVVSFPRSDLVLPPAFQEPSLDTTESTKKVRSLSSLS